jgi:hypothetical protein
MLPARQSTSPFPTVKSPDAHTRPVSLCPHPPHGAEPRNVETIELEEHMIAKHNVS